MRLRTFWYCLKQGVLNLCRNILFSLASAATISACIFLFCLFFAIVANVWHVANMVETTVGITVLFDESMSEQGILAIGDQIKTWAEVKEVQYTSAEEAWESFKAEYFKGMEELAEGFEDDNPLAGSASYTIFLNHISDQDKVVSRLQLTQGVRQVNYSNSAAAGLSGAGRIVGLMSAVIIIVLLAVAVFLISNTISVTAAFRRRENEIMRLIGATNYMIRAPFVVEGVLLGLIGALIPLGGMYYLYQKAVIYINGHFQMITGVFTPLPLESIFPYMLGTAMTLGVGIGFLVSCVTIHKQLLV